MPVLGRGRKCAEPAGSPPLSHCHLIPFMVLELNQEHGDLGSSLHLPHYLLCDLTPASFPSLSLYFLIHKIWARQKDLGLFFNVDILGCASKSHSPFHFSL